MLKNIALAIIILIIGFLITCGGTILSLVWYISLMSGSHDEGMYAFVILGIVVILGWFITTERLFKRAFGKKKAISIETSDKSNTPDL